MIRLKIVDFKTDEELINSLKNDYDLEEHSPLIVVPDFNLKRIISKLKLSTVVASLDTISSLRGYINYFIFNPEIVPDPLLQHIMAYFWYQADITIYSTNLEHLLANDYMYKIFLMIPHFEVFLYGMCLTDTTDFTSVDNNTMNRLSTIFDLRKEIKNASSCLS